MLESVKTTSPGTIQTNEAFVLTLPGRCLDVSSLINKKKKFRNRGGKDGALNAMRKLEECGMGRLVVKKSKGSIKVCYNKFIITEYILLILCNADLGLSENRYSR